MTLTSATLTALQECLEPDQGAVDLRLQHDVAIEDDKDFPAVIEGDILPVSEGDLAAAFVRSAEVPHPEQHHGTQAAAHQSVALLDALGNKQRHRGVAQL